MRPLFLGIAAVLVSLPAHGQSLPDWAEPTPYQPPAASSVAPGPGLPSDPEPVPLDGGLGLLGLAGAGLAAWRLRAKEARAEATDVA